jgi:hypothetical protein
MVTWKSVRSPLGAIALDSFVGPHSCVVPSQVCNSI